MRVSIANFVSTAAKMMRFSDESLFKNADTEDFDYVVVKWLASPEVEQYLTELPDIAAKCCPACRVHILNHATDNSVGYVPNLRSMINEGLNAGFRLNEYAGIVNTDCYFGPGWLSGLVRYAEPNRVINSLHITAVPAKYMVHPVAGIINEDLGVPEPETFNLKRFTELWEHYWEPRMVTSTEINGKGGYRQVATMPYLIPRKYWEQCGPWETTLNADPTRAPDRRFFDRINDAGAEFALSYESIIFHSEAIERRRKRPAGAEHLSEE